MTGPMKIALTGVDLKPDNLRRQPWYYLEAVYRALLDLGHDVWILTDSDAPWPDGRPHLAYPGFRAFPRGPDPGLGPRLVREGFHLVVWSTGLTDFLFRRGLDTLGLPVVAVVTSPRYGAAELISLWRRLNGERHYLKPFLLGPLITRRRMARFLRQANIRGLVFQCRETLERYLPPGTPSNRAAVIPPPLPRDFLTFLGEHASVGAAGSGTPFKVLYHGPPLSLRGLDTLIEAFASAALRMPGARLDILSRLEHPELAAREERLRALLGARGLADRVEVVSGVLSPQEVAGRLKAADLVCLPFRCVVSDVPIAVLEALAAGVPLVTTRVAGVAEFVPNGACTLVPPGDVQALVQAIISAYRKNHGPDSHPKDLRAFVDRHDPRTFREAWGRLLGEVR